MSSEPPSSASPSSSEAPSVSQLPSTTTPESPGRKRDATAPAGEENVRKRRRNRTTQSCLNCHTSKRMCDRKRPCGRCTQLGLTALCIYEVDDPNQRPDAPDESAKLRSRVAELEGIIRELKNKANPIWPSPRSSTHDELSKWQSRARSDNSPITPTVACSLPPPQSNSLLYPLNSFPLQTNSERYPQFGLPSPQSSRNSPTPSVTSVDNNSAYNPYDAASIFLSYPGPSPLACHDQSTMVPHPSTRDDPCSGNITGGHCGCLNDPLSYQTFLELSLRLRRGSDVLARSMNHQLGGPCVLKDRVSNLDSFINNTLGNMPSPSENAPSPLSLSDHPRSNSVSLYSTPISQCSQPPTPLPNNQAMTPWDMSPAAAAAAGIRWG